MPRPAARITNHLATFLIALAAVAVLLLPACSSGPDADGPVDGKSLEEQFQELAALPYVGFSAHPSRPGESGMVHHDPERSSPGYDLYTSRDLCTTTLLDPAGEVVNEWSMESCGRWANAILLPDGDLLVIGWDALHEKRAENDAARFLARLRWDGEVVWKIPLVAHHDLEKLPDGRFLVLTAHMRRLPEVDRRLPVRDNRITLVSADGRILRHYSLYDLLRAAPGLHTMHPMEPREVGGSKEIDPLHANAVQYLPGDEASGVVDPAVVTGRVLVTIRHQHLVALLDLAREEVVWTWGPGTLEGPHFARMLENGHVLIFDNGAVRRWSRVVEVEPESGKIVWQYRGDPPERLYTSSRGASQRLPNGNTLITVSDQGTALEITPEGEVVWEFFNPATDEEGRRATMFSVVRHEAGYVDGIRRHLETATDGV